MIEMKKMNDRMSITDGWECGAKDGFGSYHDICGFPGVPLQVVSWNIRD